MIKEKINFNYNYIGASLKGIEWTVILKYGNNIIDIPYFTDMKISELKKELVLLSIINKVNAFKYSIGVPEFMREYDYQTIEEAEMHFNECENIYHKLGILFDEEELEILEEELYHQ